MNALRDETKCAAYDLEDADGWIGFVNFCDTHRGATVIVSRQPATRWASSDTQARPPHRLRPFQDCRVRGMMSRPEVSALCDPRMLVCADVSF